MSQHRPNGTDAPPAQDAPVLKQWLPSRHVLLLRGVRVGVVLGGLMVLVLGLWEIGFPHTPAGRRQILHWAHYLTLGIAIVLGAGVLGAPGGRACAGMAPSW